MFQFTREVLLTAKATMMEVLSSKLDKLSCNPWNTLTALGHRNSFLALMPVIWVKKAPWYQRITKPSSVYKTKNLSQPRAEATILWTLKAHLGLKEKRAHPQRITTWHLHSNLDLQTTNKHWSWTSKSLMILKMNLCLQASKGRLNPNSFTLVLKVMMI